MHLMLTFSNGRRTEALVLAVGRNRMRIAIPSRNDAVELTLAGGQWTTDTGETLELDSLISLVDVDFPRLFPKALGAP